MGTEVWPQRQEISIHSGTDHLAAWLSVPAGDGPHPCVVMGHGFSLTRHDGLAQYAEAFANAGAAVLAFDYRHFGDSEGEPRQRFRRRTQLDDFANAVECARSQPGVDPERIVVWGFSFGGAHAIELAMSHPRIAAGVVLCPFVDGFRRVRVTPPSLSAWIIPRAIADQCGRHTLIPVTAAPGDHAAMTLPGESDGFHAVAAPGSPWRNEISPAIFLTVGAYRPVKRAYKIRRPLWVGMGEQDVSVAGDAVERLAEQSDRGELHRYPVDHFGVFQAGVAAEIAHDQVKFLRRTQVLPHEMPSEMETQDPGED